MDVDIHEQNCFIVLLVSISGLLILSYIQAAPDKLAERPKLIDYENRLLETRVSTTTRKTLVKSAPVIWLRCS